MSCRGRLSAGHAGTRYRLWHADRASNGDDVRGVAQWERTLIGARVMSGKAEQAKAGEFNGSPIPFGYTADWTIVKDEAAKLCGASSPSLTPARRSPAKSRDLNADGIHHTTRGTWQHPK